MIPSNVFVQLTKLCILATLVFALVSCGEDSGQTQLDDGLSDFKYAVDTSYQRLLKGKIKKNEGFDTECAVHWETHKGIRVSETVCDKEDKTQEITIRITDPTNRPPSQRLEKFLLDDGSGKNITVNRGETKNSNNGISVQFDRSGQSVVIVGKGGGYS